MPMLPRRWLAALVGLVLLVGVGGYLLGVHRTRDVDWHQATMPLSGVAVAGPHQRLVSVDAGGWTYAIHDSVAWVDSSGSYHDSGWPECLEPSHPNDSRKSHEQVTFRFAVAHAEDEYLVTRPVVLVEC